MKDIGSTIKSLRISREMNQNDVAKKIGVSKQTLFKYENGIVQNIPTKYIERLANLFDVSPGYIMGWQDDLDYSKIPGIKIIKKFVNVPILGEIACGQPMFCEENFEGIFQIDEDLDKPDFCLIARGDSMIDAGIHDGDIVFMRKTPVVENGKIAAVYYDEDVTLKRYYSKGNQVILQPENKFYSPIMIDLYEDIPLKILGELIGVYSKVSR